MIDKPHIIEKPWYYGPITRNACDSLLNQFGHDGDFLIRDSETNVSSCLCNFVEKYRSVFGIFTKNMCNTCPLQGVPKLLTFWFCYDSL